jgi:hypothetical protein
MVRALVVAEKPSIAKGITETLARNGFNKVWRPLSPSSL